MVSASYWHPGDREWANIYHESLEKIIEDMLEDTDWELVQQDELRAPYEHQLIFACSRSDFGL